jgi:hypothetical protein
MKTLTKLKKFKTTDKTIVVDKFHGHIILLCKGHYDYEDFYEAVKRIWEIRCGLPVFNSDSALEYIADNMYKILVQCGKNTMYLQDEIHKHLMNPTPYAKTEVDLPPIKYMIDFYRSQLSCLQIRDTDENLNLVLLPKPKKRLFNRIIKGNGKYNDYELIAN